MIKLLDKILNWRADRIAKSDCCFILHRPELPEEMK
jgi:cyclic lactone autoinducer peptide